MHIIAQFKSCAWLCRLIVRCFPAVTASVITVDKTLPLFLSRVSLPLSLFGGFLSLSAVESHTFDIQDYHSFSIYLLSHSVSLCLLRVVPSFHSHSVFHQRLSSLVSMCVCVCVESLSFK